MGRRSRGDLVTTKRRALTVVNLIRPRYTRCQLATLPEMAKPDTNREATSRSTCETDRGDWRERGVKELAGNREIPHDSLLLQARANGKT